MLGAAEALRTAVPFSNIWHAAQIIPLLHAQAQEFVVPLGGAYFRVPMTTLQRSKHEDGWGLPQVEVKCKTLLYKWIRALGACGGTVTSVLQRFWHVLEALKNPLKLLESQLSSFIFANMKST